MSAMWDDDGFGDSGAGAGSSSDPFGVSGDVFGRELGDVDPFGGNDSFGVDAEWDHFDDANFNPTEQGDKGANSASRQRASGRTSTRPPDSPRKKKGKKPSTSRGTGTSSRKIIPAVSSPKPLKAPTSRGENANHDDDENENDQRRGRSSSRGSDVAPSNSRSQSQGRRSRSRSSSAGPGGRETSTTNGKYRGTKAERKQQQSHGMLKQPTISQSSRFETTFGDDPFHSNQVDDGFGDFVTFPASHHNDENNNNNNNHGDNEGFGSFVDFGETSRSVDNSPTNRQKRPIRVRAKVDSAKVDSGVTRHSSFDDDLVPKMPSMRRNSVGHANAIALGASIHSSASSAGNSTTRFRHSRNRNGVMTRTRPSEQHTKIQESKERRSAIKDSLLGALGGENSHEEVTLENFLGSTRKTVPRRSSDAVSIHSAPAAIRAPPRSTRRPSTSQDDHHSAGSTGASLIKSKRYQRRMGSASGGSTKESIGTKEPFKLDIAELAKQGYLEVQDGKMRLVIDVEPS